MRVYKMSMFSKVRRLFHRDNLSISEIQRRTTLSRNTCSRIGFTYAKMEKNAANKILLILEVHNKYSILKVK